MPLCLDVHNNLLDVPAEDVYRAHLQDIEAQKRYGVRYHTYWFNESAGRVFCLMDAPSKEAATAVHEEAHGLLADEILEVAPGMVDALMQPDTTLYPNSQGADTAIRTIAFSDIEGSTELSDRHGDLAAMEHLRAHDAIMRACLTEHRGMEVKHTGDGIMASFVSVGRAIECAIAVQRALANHNESKAELPLRVRIGMSAGEPVAQHQDLFGAAVNLARRACDAADGGQIIVTGVVRDLCIGKGFRFLDLGDVPLRGFSEPVRLFEVDWRA
jgi:class 3 adenylate cyclase